MHGLEVHTPPTDVHPSPERGDPSSHAAQTMTTRSKARHAVVNETLCVRIAGTLCQTSTAR
jgi:hypothetical protein